MPPDNYPDTEGLQAGSGADTLYGGGGDDKLNGGNGADFMDGGAGNDTINGGNGHDTIKSGSGNDSIDGGDGNDQIIYKGNQNDYKINHDVSNTWLVVDINGSADTITNVENLTFADGNISLDLLAVIETEVTNDTLLGGANDSIEGGVGADDLFVDIYDDIIEVGDDYIDDYGDNILREDFINATLIPGGDAGNSRSSTVSTNVSLSSTGDAFISGSVSAGTGTGRDSDDYYRFFADQSGTATFKLSGLSENIDLELWDTSYRKAYSNVPGNSDESISFSVIGGTTYYIHVDPVGLISSNYNLNVDFPLIPLNKDFTLV